MTYQVVVTQLARIRIRQAGQFYLEKSGSTEIADARLAGLFAALGQLASDAL